MLDREAIRDTLVELFEAETGENPGAMDDSVVLREGLGLDSVDVVSVVMQIERRYRIRLNHEELEPLVSVGQLVDLIQAKVAASQSQPAAA